MFKTCLIMYINRESLFFLSLWLSDIKLNKLCGALFIDFAKAFDVISHNLLLKKMNRYGLTIDTFNLIKSFLSDHHQVSNQKSSQLYLVFHNDLF